ncbi:MAG: Stk1 family PASTA domain-containing Ser/Thr kinase [Lachnospiraceae bacterium]
MIIENRYEILEKIGTGGMSDVYKAKCHKLNRFVAIKFLKPEFSEDKNFVINFRVEAQSAAALLHPNVVSVYDVNVTDGIYYIVMEYVDGITLKKYVNINGKLPIKEATGIAIQVVQGMEAAHNAGIIHRDIKPQNVLISREGKIKVTDFGIARKTTASTLSADVLGSAQYISPEQARGDIVDERSDIYSFGILFYEMITGSLPFEGDSPVTVALKHIQDQVPLVSDSVPGVPSSVVKIIEKCTQKRAERRYQKTSSLLSDLKTSLVNPNDDFVTLAPETDDSATVVMSREDARLLMEEGRKAEMTAPQRSGQPKKKYIIDDEFDDEIDDIKDHSGRKFEKILAICGIAAGVIIVVALIIIIISWFGKGTCGGKNGKNTTESETETLGPVEVPNLIGLTLAKAQDKLDALGLDYEVKSEKSDVEVDEVIRQSIDAGEEVNAGTKITITVSAGRDTVELENLAGQEQAKAIATLKAAGLKYSITTRYDDDVETGIVIETNPVGGSEIARNSTVELIVSRGKESKKSTVPAVIGSVEVDAWETCVAAGLKVEIKYQTNNEQAGKVISQSLPGGSNVEEGTTITLIVGKLAQVKVPNVVGMDIVKAKAECESAGLVVKADKSKGKVIEQSIKAGEKVDQGTKITLTVVEETTKPPETTTEATTAAEEPETTTEETAEP